MIHFLFCFVLYVFTFHVGTLSVYLNNDLEHLRNVFKKHIAEETMKAKFWRRNKATVLRSFCIIIIIILVVVGLLNCADCRGYGTEISIPSTNDDVAVDDDKGAAAGGLQLSCSILRLS